MKPEKDHFAFHIKKKNFHLIDSADLQDDI